MKILLVYPEYPVTFWSFKYALRFVNKQSNLPPLGILTVAAMLPEEWDLRLVDMNVEPLRDSQIAKADYVMISAMNIQQKSVREVMSRCKAMGKKIICGGPLFSTEPEKYDDADHLLLYEGEDSIPAFLEDLKNGTPKHIYDKKSFPHLSHTPVPRWDLLKKNAYAMMSLQFSRGCPFNCEFCNIVSLFGRSPRTKSPVQILTELEAIYAAGWRGGIFFVDDNFIGNKKLLKQEVLPAMIDWMKKHDYPFTFFTEVSINLSDDEELMNLMADAGFDNVFIGIETIDENCLDECNKVQNLSRDLSSCVKKIQQHGMQVQGGFILGFDHEKPTIFQNMINFIQNSGIVTAMVGLLTAPPGTRLYDRMKEEGRISSEFTGLNTDTNTNIIPKMDMNVLLDGYKKVVHGIYNTKNYYQRVRTFLENYRPRRLHRKKLQFVEIMAFFKSCLLFGIRDKNREDFWALLSWAWKKRKQAAGIFSRAVTFSIYGYHFRKCLPEGE